MGLSLIRPLDAPPYAVGARFKLSKPTCGNGGLAVPGGVLKLVIVIDGDIERPVVFTGSSDHSGGITDVRAAPVTPRKRPGRKHLYPVRDTSVCRGGKDDGVGGLQNTAVHGESLRKATKKHTRKIFRACFWPDVLAQSGRDGCL